LLQRLKIIKKRGKKLHKDEVLFLILRRFTAGDETKVKNVFKLLKANLKIAQ
jgi:hypothetical protein